MSTTTPTHTPQCAATGSQLQARPPMSRAVSAPPCSGCDSPPTRAHILVSMRIEAAALCGLLALAVALTGCGASHKSAPARAPKRAVVTSRAPQLISMRRIDGATWQTVVIRTDGTGDVAIFIGEWTGYKHRTFRLSSGA